MRVESRALPVLPAVRTAAAAYIAASSARRRCRLHYYPSDRSARVEDPKWEDNGYEGDQWNKSKLPMAGTLQANMGLRDRLY